MIADSMEVSASKTIVDFSLFSLLHDSDIYKQQIEGKKDLPSVIEMLKGLWSGFYTNSSTLKPSIKEILPVFEQIDSHCEELLCPFAELLLKANDNGILPYEKWHWKAPDSAREKCIHVRAFLAASQYFSDIGLFHGVEKGFQYICPAGIEFCLEDYLDQKTARGNTVLSFLGNYCEMKEEADYSTLRMLVSECPDFPLGPIYGAYERYPLEPGDWEGGLRTKGIYKKSREDYPLVTYVTVVYNRASDILQCMESIWNQTYPNIEYIVIDGGSTDGTLEILKQYENKIDYCISQHDTGTYNAMNKGISLASGDYLCFMNSDDRCTFNAAEIVAKIAKETKSDVISGRRYFKGPRNRIREEQRWPRFHLRKCPMVYTYMVHQSLYGSAKAYNKIGMLQEKYFIISDFIWEADCLNKRLNVVFTDELLSIFSRTGASAQFSKIMHQEWCEYIRTIYPKISAFDAQALFYSMRPSQWEYDLTVLTNLAKKYFDNLQFKCAYYQAALFTCIKQCRFDLSPLAGKYPELEKKFFQNLPCGIRSAKELEGYLTNIMNTTCAEECYAVSKHEIDELCKIKKICNDYLMKSNYRKNAIGMKSTVKTFFKQQILKMIRSSNYLMVCFLKSRVA